MEWVWKAIKLHRNSLSDNTTIRIGNSRKTLFWRDNWIEHGLLKDLFPEFYSIATLLEAKLETLWVNMNGKLLLEDS